jgi:hypothetical protein
MGIVGLWTSVSTHQSAIFSAAPVGFADDSWDACEARADTAILAPGYVALPLWTASPRRGRRLSGSQNHQCRDHAIYEFTP